MNFSRQSPSRTIRWRRLVMGAGALLAVIAIALGLSKGWIVAEVQAVLQKRLAERHLRADWGEVSWSLWQGSASFKNFTLRESTGEGKPLVEADALVVGIAPWEWLMPSNRREISWNLRDSRVVLTDAVGRVALEDVSARVGSRRGKVVVKSVQARVGGLEVDLKGGITLRTPAGPKPFVMKLQPLRGTLAALDFDKDSGPFKVTGSFDVDMQGGPPFKWSARLKGGGKGSKWKGVPLQKAGAEAELSSVDSVIRAGLSTEHGQASAVIERKGGWKETPFTFAGSIEDRAKNRDAFRGEYKDRALLVETLAGDADLWTIARDVPALAKGQADAVVFQRFPDIEAKGIRWKKADGWSVEKVMIRKSGSAVVKWEQREIAVNDLRGAAGYEDEQWRLEGIAADLLEGSVRVNGTYAAGRLSKADVKADGLKISAIKKALGKKKAAGPDGVLSLNYSGAARFKDLEFNGSGNVRLDNAPVIEVPLLDEVHELFATLIPGVKPSGEGKFEADFVAEGEMIRVKRFRATGGTLVVDAEGDVDLKKQTVAGTARGKLTGLPGVVTSPLSQLLEMEVGGSLQKIKVQRLRPGKVISNAASGVVDTIKGVGKGVKKATE